MDPEGPRDHVVLSRLGSQDHEKFGDEHSGNNNRVNSLCSYTGSGISFVFLSLLLSSPSECHGSRTYVLSSDTNPNHQ